MKLSEILARVELAISNEDSNAALGAINVGLIFYPRNPELIEFFNKIIDKYDSDFFNSSSIETYQSAQSYLQLTELFYKYSTVADVGAGMGSWSRAAVEMGKNVISIDGEWVEKINPNQSLKYIFLDLNHELKISRKFDLSICVEVAEHLAPERSESFIFELCQLSDVIIFGAALPRQGGVGHINCRPHSFWIDLFSINGFEVLDAFRPSFWYNGRVAPYYTQNTFLFCKKKYAWLDCKNSKAIHSKCIPSQGCSRLPYNFARSLIWKN